MPGPAGIPLAGLRPSANPGCSLASACLAAGADRPESDVQVTGVTLDSRTVRPGDLYAALPGARAHGADFAAAVEAAGAVSLLTDPEGRRRAVRQGCTLPLVVVPDPRGVLGAVAAEVYRHPSRDLQLLGVTGTNGKTTTTYLLDAVLRAAGRTTGLVGTVEIRVADQRVPSVRTTPEAPDLHGLLAAMRERGVHVCSMEVSSQALAQHRVDGAVYDVAAFTNFSQDHLELHGDMASYLAAKSLLLTPEHSREAVVVVDDEGSRAAAAGATVPVTTLSASGHSGADWLVTDPTPVAGGTDFVLERAADGLRLPLRCPLPGDFNVANAALAAVVLLRAGLSTDEVTAGLAVAGGVPGRMERVGDAEDGPLAVVDYAHTPGAVAAALATLRSAATGRLVVVLGAGGDRDPGKRAAMGAAAARGADVVLVTDDNPRSEDPAAIRAAVLSGARAATQATQTTQGTPATQPTREGVRDGAGPAEVVEVPSRREAIRRAVALAGPGDVVLVAGKGHETGQEVAGVVHPFDDRDELRAALAELAPATGSGRRPGPERAR